VGGSDCVWGWGGGVFLFWEGCLCITGFEAGMAFPPPRPDPNNPRPPALAGCRYQKFRKLGQFEEWVVKGSEWQATRETRSGAEGVRTAAGTWAANEAEARYIEVRGAQPTCEGG